MEHRIAIVAGKGGVGKSTVAVQLARCFQERGYRIGLLDADLYGPSLHVMLPEEIAVQAHPEKEGILLPARARGMALMSMAYFTKVDAAVSVRAPIANSLIKQFIHQVEWGALDCLLIDFPPGTGDIQLTLLQEAGITGAIVVATPQEVALSDVKKAVQMLETMGIPLLGLVENMSYFLEKQSGEHCFPLGRGKAERYAQEAGLYFLGKLPLSEAISAAGDEGRAVLECGDSDAKRAFEELASCALEQMHSLAKISDKNFEIVEMQSSSNQQFTIQWANGKIHHFEARLLQDFCPCVRCREKEKALPREEEVAILAVERIGRYAVQFQFSSGCSRGIYPVELLYEKGKG